MRLAINPVMAREARERFRGRRTGILVTAWVLGQGIVTWLLFLLGRSYAQGTGLGRVIATGLIGRFLFESLALVLMTGVVMVVPGLAALTIVGERERQTFQLLQVSQLTPFQIIWGKLTSSIAFFMLLLIAIIPMAAVPLLFGGASFGDVFAVLGTLLLTALLLGSIGMWVSSVSRSSRGAIAGAYGLAFTVAFLSFALLGVEVVAFRPDQFNLMGPEGREFYSMSINPYMAMIDAVDQPYELRQNTGSPTPFSVANQLLFARQAIDIDATGWVSSVAPGTIRIVDGRQMVRTRRPPLWIITSVLYIGIIALSLWRSTAAVRAPAGRLIRTRRTRDEGS